ncbi:sensor histidine kinase [Agromyces seonyuensis]|uniref:histidine kinase n=1 Tax=Agromyces seonyuensis TaxID=2662446 RepID=A0A6I4P7W0_9MICO|nr:histidine kinase [Agromyces seonyuensis]MWB99994.1 sensor histidine kinase [Agromyces seonyuensis]
MDERGIVPRRTPWGIVWRALLAAAIGGVLWLIGLGVLDYWSLSRPEQIWYLTADPAIGALAIAGVLCFSRRAPVLVGIAASAIVLLGSVAAMGAALLALGSVATRQRSWEIAIVAACDLVAFRWTGLLVYPTENPSLPWWESTLIFGLGFAIVIATGISIGQRRELVAGLRERAAAAEREQAARALATRVGERNRIARDLHDVVAHRVSLVAMQSSALELRPDLPEEERTAALGAIGENARLALDELRGMLGVLRDPAAVAASADAIPDEPGIADVAALVDESRAAGMHVELISAVEGEPPPAAAQTAYRVIRESLTNALKHATGASVTVSIAGEAGEGLAVRVRNGPRANTVAPRLPGSGTGLAGLRERVVRAGGRFEAGVDGDGYAVSAWLPWAT